MTQTYRGDDLTRWGTGKTSDLTATELNINFWDIIQRIIDLEALPDAAAGIDYFEVSGTQFYVHMTDHSIKGPYDLPVATFRDRGEWAVLTTYVTLDTFTINGGLYLVIFDHVSDATSFDAGANDGLGHDYYQLMIQTPGSSLPTGGATDQVLQKSTSSDYATTWGWKLPTGGTTRQYLVKQSGTNQDAIWDDPTASDIEFVPVTGSTLSSTTVDAAIEEIAATVAGISLDAADISYTPGGDLVAADVGAALDELDTDLDAKADTTSLVGRQTVWIPATAMTPGITAGPSIGSIEMTTFDNMVNTLDYDATTQENAQFCIAMPNGWNKGGIYFQPYWSHPATATNFGVTWAMDAVAISDNQTLDVSFGTGAQFTSDTGGTTDKLYVAPESSIMTVDGTPADGDLVLFRVFRFPSGGSDTMAVDARLHGIKLIYVTDAPTDA